MGTEENRLKTLGLECDNSHCLSLERHEKTSLRVVEEGILDKQEDCSGSL